jgi:hypothetical protein
LFMPLSRLIYLVVGYGKRGWSVINRRVEWGVDR